MQVQIKQFLERVYGLRVASVQTVNYDGKKKRRKTGFFKKPDYKKVREGGRGLPVWAPGGACPVLVYHVGENRHETCAEHCRHT